LIDHIGDLSDRRACLRSEVGAIETEEHVRKIDYYAAVGVSYVDTSLPQLLEEFAVLRKHPVVLGDPSIVVL
jgi:hypothetical protein